MSSKAWAGLSGFVVTLLTLILLPTSLVEAAALAPEQLIYADQNSIHLTNSDYSIDTVLLSVPGGVTLSGDVLISPDRRFVYYGVGVPGTGSVVMHRMNADGTGVTNLGYTLASGLPSGISPDGKRIAYIVSANPTTAGRRISVRNIDGTGAVTTSPNIADFTSGAQGAVWVTNERVALAYRTVNNACAWRIGTINVDGSNLTPLTLAGDMCGSMGGIKVSKDGARLLYYLGSGYDGTTPSTAKAYIMDVDGTDRTQVWEAASLTGSGGNVLYAQFSDIGWSVDESKLAVATIDFGNNASPSLEIVDIATATREQVIYPGAVGVEW